MSEDESLSDDQPTATRTPPNGASEIPQRIGPYRILREIGNGGMGVVYEAEQETPVRRKVALKLVKLGMDTREFVARFESERQALALMSHPNIARVYDAGATAEGRPYFAMEYIQGVPITEYCDRHRLTIPERLRLFVDVCEGVQHAHQKGIIHRDIKPSNVLVTTQDDKRTPKIIDFGVAKAISQRLTDHDVHTELGQLIGTPEYMSPEQAEMTNLDIDTRADVYSLGAVLYELLAGSQPFDSKELRRAGLVEIQRKLREEDPPLPSRRISGMGPASTVSATNRHVDARGLQRALDGELDWITMKALEKDRVRRYETAHALALDVERYLGDEPVLAGPQSAMYRTRKLLRRHRTGVLAVAGVALALVAGMIGTSWALLRARAAERRAAAEAVEAKRQAASAAAVNAFLNDDLLAAVAPSSQRGQGKDVTMREVLDAAAARMDGAAAKGGRFVSEPLVEASIRGTLGRTYLQLGTYASAEPHLQRALALRRETLGEEHPDTVRAMNALGMLLWRESKLGEAEALFARSGEISRRVLGPDDADTMTYEMNLANVYRAQGRYREAEPIYARNLDSKRRVLGSDHRDTVATMVNLANTYQETGRYGEAEALHRQVLDAYRRLDGEKAPDTVSAMNNLANDLALLGRFEEAAPLMQRALDAKLELYGPDHPSTLNSITNLAELDNQLGRDAEAEVLHRRALEGRSRVLGPQHARSLSSMERLAYTLANRGRFAEAERLASVAAEQAARSLDQGHEVTVAAQDTRARALIGLQRAPEAESLLRRQLAILAEKKARGEEAGEGEPLVELMRLHLGMALAALGRRAEAEPLLIEAVPRLAPHEAETTRALRYVVRFYEDWNRSQPDPAREARAAEWRARLDAVPGPSAER